MGYSADAENKELSPRHWKSVSSTFDGWPLHRAARAGRPLPVGAWPGRMPRVGLELSIGLCQSEGWGTGTGSKKSAKKRCTHFCRCRISPGMLPAFLWRCRSPACPGGGGGEAGASGLSRTLRDHTFLRFAHPRGEGATTPHGAARGKCGRFYAVRSGGGVAHYVLSRPRLQAHESATGKRLVEFVFALFGQLFLWPA